MDPEEGVPLVTVESVEDKDDVYDNTEKRPVLRQSSSHDLAAAAERVKFLLGKEGEDGSGASDPKGEGHDVHSVFCQLDELKAQDDDADVVWREAARWVKFEEDVEEGGQRWSKPYVATLSLHSLYQVRDTILQCSLLLDVEAANFFQLSHLMVEKMIADKQLAEEDKELVLEVLLSRHRHLHDKKKRKLTYNASFEGKPGDQSGKRSSRRQSTPVQQQTSVEGKKFGRRGSIDVNSSVLPKTGSKSGQFLDPASASGNIPKVSSVIGGIERDHSGNEIYSTKFNKDFLKKIPAGAETANVLVGEVDFLDKPIACFVRLNKPCLLQDITEVSIESRFVFMMLGPVGDMKSYHQVGRAFGTLMSDEIFHGVMYKAKGRDDILAAMDEFLVQTTVLPPGEWDPTIRLEPPTKVPSQDPRRGIDNAAKQKSQELNKQAQERMLKAKEKVIQSHEEEELQSHADPTLQRTGKLFGGLRRDLARKLPLFLSDIKDGLHIQCIASLFFMYFACLTPIITFGGLLGAATDNNLAAMESLLAGAICGISYHMFSGQPLTIIGSTGPVLVFETIVFNFSGSMGWNYLSFRFWIGLWISLALLLMVAFDLSALVRYITRFTEESFAMLISLIFIVEAFKKLFHILDHAAVNLNPDEHLDHTCNCLEPNSTDDGFYNETYTRPPPMNYSALDPHDCEEYGGIPEGPGCDLPHYVADVFFFSCLLFLGTFIMAIKLKGLKTSRFFPTKVRNMIANFGVMASIVVMAGTDALVGLDTPKLLVPDTFKPTRDDRGWIINPFVNPVYCIAAAIPPALLATILIFMDQQITAVIVNRKENKLLKGGGYHLDLFVITIQIAVNSVLGLPWFVAATVLSINHVVSLSRETESAAPGERPTFLGIREQRVTGIITFILVGLSVFMTDILAQIPMAVLYGVFLYMGVSALTGVQLVQRVSILFMPPKYQPDYIFLRHVTLRRTHLFTLVQVICLACLWTIKSIKSISIIFPLMVLAMCFVRKALDYVFTQRELKWLDDIMPESHKREKEEKKKKQLAEIQEEFEETKRKLSANLGIIEEEDDTVAIPAQTYRNNNNGLKQRNGLDVSFKEEDETNPDCSSV